MSLFVQGAGTRKGNGKCSCDPGYEGEFCNRRIDFLLIMRKGLIPYTRWLEYIKYYNFGTISFYICTKIYCCTILIPNSACFFQVTGYDKNNSWVHNSMELPNSACKHPSFWPHNDPRTQWSLMHYSLCDPGLHSNSISNMVHSFSKINTAPFIGVCCSMKTCILCRLSHSQRQVFVL